MDGASRPRRDLRADDRDLGDWLQRPLRRVDPGRLGGDARPVALEARGRADQHVARGRVAVVGERVRHAARGEGELARALGDDGIVDLEDQLALEYVEGLVEVVRVQWGAGVGGGTTISVTDTLPSVSSLRSRTFVVRFGTDGIV